MGSCGELILVHLITDQKLRFPDTPIGLRSVSEYLTNSYERETPSLSNMRKICDTILYEKLRISKKIQDLVNPSIFSRYPSKLQLVPRLQRHYTV